MLLFIHINKMPMVNYKNSSQQLMTTSDMLMVQRPMKMIHMILQVMYKHFNVLMFQELLDQITESFKWKTH